MKRKLCIVLVLTTIMLCLFASCGSKQVSGTYRCESNSDISMTFEGNSSDVLFSDGENSVEGSYSILDSALIVSFQEVVNWPILNLESPSSEMIFEIKNNKTLVTNLPLASGDVELMTFKKVGLLGSIWNFVKKNWVVILIVLFVLGLAITIYEKVTGRDLEEDIDRWGDKIDQKLDNFGEKLKDKEANPIPQTTETQNAELFCAKCGTKLIEGASFCQKCGTPVTPSATPSAGAATAPQEGRQSAPIPSSVKPQAQETPQTTPVKQSVGMPPQAPQSGGNPQAPSAGQPGGAPPWNYQAAPGNHPVMGANPQTANRLQMPGGYPGAAPSGNSPVHGRGQMPPVGYPGFVPAGMLPKRKKPRWPWVVGGVGIAAVVLVAAAILGNSISPVTEPSSAETPSSSESISLTETYTNEEEGFSFQYPSAWKPVAQENMTDYNLPEDNPPLVLLANEHEDIPEADSYLMVSRYDATEEDEAMFDLDDEAFLDAIGMDGSNMETWSFSIDEVPIREVSYTVEADNRYQRTYYYVANQGFFRVDMWCSIAQSSEYTRFFDAVMDSYTITVFPEEEAESDLTADQYIQMVVNGYRVDAPDLTYGDAFNAFFGSPHWEFFVSEEGEKIVEFTGDCTYQDAPVTACIQFVINETDNTFEATWLDFNGVPQSQLILNALITKAFGALEGTANIDWTASTYSFVMENDLYASITFYPDGTFSMVANLYEGLGNVSGTYTVMDDRLECYVTNRDFGGFIGDDVQEFAMLFAGDNLQYSGQQIGTSLDGATYTPG